MSRYAVHSFRLVHQLELAEKLQGRKTYLVGTLRKNRRLIQKEILSTKLDKGEIAGREKNGIIIFKWKDEPDVHKLNFVEVSCRTETNKKLEAIVAYNNAKSFIDVSD
ncbi:unnamed protein product [Acanthoscelides obtectus]|uniref:PiggyBac transposable element-derived protein domain-containing protein n=1 Tax=Acanthoscelides obtectus TaxID=200917 RepID=A0A9P0MFK8_ACAOB|nr:unnamed protein product [Acanthoscelides obtectus]CAK1630864.1 hypothetical protein AOBTE_LOCUS6599 [Acanthoscelides obtectus]